MKITVGSLELDQPLNFRTTKEQVETDKVAPYIELVTDGDGYVTGGKGKFINLETGATLTKGGAGAKNFRRFQDFRIRGKGEPDYIYLNFTQSGGRSWYPNDGDSLEFDVEYVDPAEKIKADDVGRAEVRYRVTADPAHPKVQGFLYRWVFSNN